MKRGITGTKQRGSAGDPKAGPFLEEQKHRAEKGNDELGQHEKAGTVNTQLRKGLVKGGKYDDQAVQKKDGNIILDRVLSVLAF